MKRVKRPRSIQDAAIQRYGVRKGAVAAAHVALMAMATRDLGHVPTNAQYAEFWYMSERAGWMHRAEVREILGDDWREDLERLAAEAERRSLRSPRAVAALGT